MRRKKALVKLLIVAELAHTFKYILRVSATQFGVCCTSTFLAEIQQGKIFVLDFAPGIPNSTTNL